MKSLEHDKQGMTVHCLLILKAHVCGIYISLSHQSATSGGCAVMALSGRICIPATSQIKELRIGLRKLRIDNIVVW